MHRSGRTGRAGKVGLNIVFCSNIEDRQVQIVIQHQGQTFWHLAESLAASLPGTRGTLCRPQCPPQHNAA